MNSELNPLRLIAEPSDESGRERRAKRVREHYDRAASNKNLRPAVTCKRADATF